MSRETFDLLRRIADEKNIALDDLEEALTAALVSASRKMLDPEMEVTRADIDPRTGEYHVFANKEVVQIVENENREVSLAEARLYDLGAIVGGVVEIDVTPPDFGRIAAQNAKQVVTQRIREAEREMVYERYSGRIGELVSGTVQQYERGNVVVDIGYAEATLPFNEQPKGERYHYGDRLRAVILDVNQTARDAQVVLSRKTPELVSKLFEQEVTEVREGTVTIRHVAREPGRRSKIAVSSNNLDVDPVGACVGMKGSRVQMVVQELRGERIDIIPFSQDLSKFVANALKPATVQSIELSEDRSFAHVVVDDDMLSLAIGKGGINAKLATDLTGVHVNIYTESQVAKEEQEARNAILALPGVDEDLADQLLNAGVLGFEDVVDYGVADLVGVAGLEEAVAKQIVAGAERFLSGEETPAYMAEDEGLEEFLDDPSLLDDLKETEPSPEPEAGLPTDPDPVDETETGEVTSVDAPVEEAPSADASGEDSEEPAQG